MNNYGPIWTEVKVRFAMVWRDPRRGGSLKVSAVPGPGAKYRRNGCESGYDRRLLRNRSLFRRLETAQGVGPRAGR